MRVPPLRELRNASIRKKSRTSKRNLACDPAIQSDLRRENIFGLIFINRTVFFNFKQMNF
jgi:hypothetical protein